MTTSVLSTEGSFALEQSQMSTEFFKRHMHNRHTYILELEHLHLTSTVHDFNPRVVFFDSSQQRLEVPWTNRSDTSDQVDGLQLKSDQLSVGGLPVLRGGREWQHKVTEREKIKRASMSFCLSCLFFALNKRTCAAMKWRTSSCHSVF